MTEHALGGRTFAAEYLGFYGATALLIVGVGAYDLITRKRLHSAYVAGAWGLAGQLTAIVLYENPAWAAFTARPFHP